MALESNTHRKRLRATRQTLMRVVLSYYSTMAYRQIASWQKPIQSTTRRTTFFAAQSAHVHSVEKSMMKIADSSEYLRMPMVPLQCRNAQLLSSLFTEMTMTKSGSSLNYWLSLRMYIAAPESAITWTRSLLTTTSSPISTMASHKDHAKRL